MEKKKKDKQKDIKEPEIILYYADFWWVENIINIMNC